MKVVFLEDVPDVAEVGDIKEVADGYGRNFLIPRKLAVLVDSQAANIVESRLRKKARQMAQIEAEMKELAGQIEGKGIVLKAKAGAKEKLYGSVTNADIAEGLEKSYGVTVDKRKIELAEPIREVGTHEVTIRLTKDVTPTVKVTVEEEATQKAAGTEKKTGKTRKTEAAEEKDAESGEQEAQMKAEEPPASGEEEAAETGVEETEAEETEETS